jgi:hypothetical protein
MGFLHAKVVYISEFLCSDIPCMQKCLLQEFNHMMDPKQGVTPRKRSRSLYRFEPSYTSLIEQKPDHVNSFKRMGCWRYYQKLEGHHMKVSIDFVKNYNGGKNKVGPLEFNMNMDMIVEATETPIIRELWFKTKKLEREYWCQDMLKPENQGANLVKGIPRNWLLEAYEKLFFIIQIFFTCEGRYIRVLQYHFKMLLHFTGKREIDLPYFLFMRLQRMFLLAQKNPNKIHKSIFHHALIKLIVIEKLKEEGREWLTFLFVSKYQVDMPISPSKSKTPKKNTVILSSDLSYEVPQSSQDPIPQEPSPVQVYKRYKRKGKAKEVVIEDN